MENQELNNSTMNQNLNESNSSKSDESTSFNNAQIENSSSNSGLNANDRESQSRHYKKNNKRIAEKRNVKQRKEEKRDRLEGEREAKKADLNRGYRIVEVEDEEGETSNKHFPIDGTERAFIESGIADLDNQIYDVKTEIELLEQEIKDLSQSKKSSLKSKLKNKKRDKKISKALKSAERFVKKSSENGQKQVIDDIKYKAQSNKDQEAYQSLLQFLRSEPSPIKRTVSKDPELEDAVIEKLLNKINNGQF